MVCPSVCPQTNRMKAWPLFPPRVFPFFFTSPLLNNQRILVQHLRKRERAREREKNNSLNVSSWNNEREVNFAKQSKTPLRFFQGHSYFVLNYLCGRCGCSLFWIPGTERKAKHQRKGVALTWNTKLSLRHIYHTEIMTAADKILFKYNFLHRGNTWCNSQKHCCLPSRLFLCSDSIFKWLIMSERIIHFTI